MSEPEKMRTALLQPRLHSTPPTRRYLRSSTHAGQYTSRVSASCLALLASCLMACDKAASQETTRPLPVETLRVHRQESFSIRRRFSGVVRARSESAIAFELSGQVARVFVRQGDQVKRGARLAVLDTRVLRADRSRLRAELTQARASSENAAAQAARVRALAEESFASPQRMDNANEARRVGAARVEALEAALVEIEVRLSQSVLTAPFNGTITRRSLDIGTVSQPGKTVFALRGDGALEAVFGLPAKLALAAGGSTKARVRGHQLLAKPYGNPSNVASGTRLTELVYSLEESADITPLPGETVEIDREETVYTPGFWLPLDALRQGPRGTWEALALRQHAGRTQLEALALTAIHPTGDRVFVDGTIRDKQELVASGLHRLVPGQTVVRSVTR